MKPETIGNTAMLKLVDKVQTQIDSMQLTK